MLLQDIKQTNEQTFNYPCVVPNKTTASKQQWQKHTPTTSTQIVLPEGQVLTMITNPYQEQTHK